MVANKTFRLMDGEHDAQTARGDIRAAYQQGEEAIIQLFDHYFQDLQTMQDQLNKNSKNSSKPPVSRKPSVQPP